MKWGPRVVNGVGTRGSEWSGDQVEHGGSRDIKGVILNNGRRIGCILGGL